MGNRVIKTVTVKNVTFGEGIPKILVPITGTSPDDLRAQVDALAAHHVDVVEWRVDYFSHLADPAIVLATGRALAVQLSETPLLFTCRTQVEGGEAIIEDEAYGELNVALIESGTVDLVDVEYQRQRAVVERILATAHSHSVPVIASNHDFSGTPARDEILARLQEMQRLGADICKIAVMPHSASDVLILLDATLTMHEKYADRPLITMSMGRLGVVSRLSGQVFGSAASFGMVGTPSAPGQLDADDLHKVMALLDRAK
jgi:3-dehydroquinate dehydratase I